MKASTLLWAVFPPKTIRLLKELARFISERDQNSYLVGGAVRDALLGVPTADIDIMLEGELFSVVQEVKEAWGSILPGTPAPSKVLTFPKYQTAKLIFPTEVAPGVIALDFSGARREQYLTPGAQPVVSPGTLEEDLARRDFSINAMALALAPGRFGEVVDLFSGQEHLRDGKLAVLHDQSFEDDPARLIRGARFIARFDFSWTAETRSLAEAAAQGDYLQTIKAERRFDELKKALSERKIAGTVTQLEQLGLLPHLTPRAVIDARVWGVLSELEKAAHQGALTVGSRKFESWKFVLAALFLGVTEGEFSEVLISMQLAQKQITELLAIRRELEQLYAS